MSVYFVLGLLTVATVLIAHGLAGLAFRRHIAALGRRLQRPPAAASRSRPPEAVRRFAARAGVTGPTPVAIRLRQVAELRMGRDKPWMPIGAEQIIAVSQPGFVWQAERRMGPLCLIRILDAYVDGHGELQARLLGSLPVARQTGADIDRGEIMRYLAELPWAPDALLANPALQWRNLGNRSVEVAAAGGGPRAAVRLYFDDEGDIVEILADARGSTERGVVVQRPWRGVFSDYETTGGRRIPLTGEVGYVYDDGYAAYWRGRIAEYCLI